MKYTIRVLEHYKQDIEVEADSEEQARQIVKTQHENGEINAAANGEFHNISIYSENGES